eukprot:g39506.t1
MYGRRIEVTVVHMENCYSGNEAASTGSGADMGNAGRSAQGSLWQVHEVKDGRVRRGLTRVEAWRPPGGGHLGWRVNH